MMTICKKKLHKNVIKKMTIIFFIVLSAMIISMGYIACEKVEASNMTWKDGSITAVLNDNGVLTISGSGAMTDYTYTTASQVPWYGYKSQISKIVIEEGITHIGGYSFKDASIEEVSLPKGLTSIGDGAFCGCNLLSEISFPDSLTSIGNTSFYECKSLCEINIPDKVISIGEIAFAECSAIESITLGNSVEEIGVLAFSKTSIKALYIPKSVISIGDEMCNECSNLEAYEVSSGNSVYSSEDGVLFNKNKTILISCPGARTGSYTVPSTVTSIYAHAFYKCTSLTSLVIPDSVTSIDISLAVGCTSLVKVVIGSGIERLENYAFSDCINLTDVTLKEGLKEIGENAFENCTSLTSLIIPDSVTRIEANAFENCESLNLTVSSSLTELANGTYILADEISVTGTLNYSMAYEALDLINEEREAEGLSSLIMDKDLLEAAMQRAAEISVYFSHTRPSGMSWSTSYSYTMIAGENIAAGYTTASSVVAGWMDSAVHKSNILGSAYASTGIGCFKHNGILYWVQVFRNDSATKVTQPSDTTKSVSIVVDPSLLSDYIYLAVSSSSLLIGGKATYEVCVKNPGWTTVHAVLDPDSFTWSSGSTSVAAVSPSGVVTAKGAGNATIKATSATGCLSVSSTISVTCATPTISSISNTSSGVKISWSAISGASKYQVWRKASSGSWTKLGTTNYTSYTDKTAKGGTSYYYRLRCVTSDGTTAASSYSSSKCIKRLANATISSLTNTTSGIKVKWSKVTGANGYYVYRKLSGGSYSMIKNITSGSTVNYTDTVVKSKSGKSYTYYVIPYYKNSSGAITKGTYANTKTIIRLSSAKVSSLTNGSSGITVKWSKITGANGYYIYRRTSGGSYSLIKTITSGSTVSYTDTIVKSKNGTTYLYYVIPYYKNSSGAITKGSYANTKTTVRLTAVSISSVSNSSSKKMTVKWTKNSKVTGYQIQYSTSSGFSTYKTVTVTGTSSVSKVISSLTKGKIYYVRVRAYKTVGNTKYYSAWSSKKSVKISR